MYILFVIIAARGAEEELKEGKKSNPVLANNQVEWDN